MLFTLHFVLYSIILIIFNRGISGVVLLFSADVIPCGFLCVLSRYRSHACPSLRPASVVFLSQPALVVFALVFVASTRTSVLSVVISPLAHYSRCVCASEAVATIVPYLVARAPLLAPHSDRI